MDKRKQIERVAENEDDRVLFARVYDRLTGAEQKNIPGATCFLAPREQVLIKRLLPHMELNFFGGSPEAERAVCYNGNFIPIYYQTEYFVWQKNVNNIIFDQGSKQCYYRYAYKH